MGAIAIIGAIAVVAGTATSIYGGNESRRANRRMEERNREQEAEHQRQVEQERRLAEEQARIEKERLLKNVGFQREELAVKETIFKAQRELEQKQIAEKVINLRQTYDDIYADYNSTQTIRGLTQTLAPKQTRLTQDYLKDNEGIALLKSFMQTQSEQGVKAMNIAKEELNTVEKLGKETGELNLKGITNKAEAELQMSQFRIRGMREQMNDLNKASVLNDIGSLFKMGAQLAGSYMEQNTYKSMMPKFNYSGNSYDEMIGHLNFNSFGKSGRAGNAFNNMGLSSVFG